MKIIKSLFYLLPFIFFACQDDIEETTTLELEFIHKAGNEDFEYGKIYQNNAGNEFSLRLWRTYISDVKLMKSDGELYAVPDSYHLIEPVDGNKFSLKLNQIPSEKYKAIQFYVGVVGEENLSGEIVGDLDPSNNMAWNWTTGYKFIRMDGEFQDELGNRRGVVVHIGKEINLKPQVFNFQQDINFSGQINKLSFDLDLLEAFQNPHTIDFEVLSDFQFNDEANLIGENYAEGFVKLIE
ncbi:MbnP family protein [Marivirga sp.]|uniref:MbnP family protein n=1 Tax=Marivirga sp. TaxID=2018662 RepID=UPI0025FCA53A|nr:MbnP family protein [Marivirga sp.]